MKEIRAARAKAKAEALARAQMLAAEDDDEETEEVVHEPVIIEELYKAPEEARRRRPLMPLKKLAEKGKADRQARAKSEVDKEALDARGAAEGRKQSILMHEEAASEPEGEVETEEKDDKEKEDEAELEGIIAKLRQEALDRRLNKIHRAQKDQKLMHRDNGNQELAKDRDVDDEARLRRPGIVKSRKVSTKEE